MVPFYNTLSLYDHCKIYCDYLSMYSSAHVVTFLNLQSAVGGDNQPTVQGSFVRLSEVPLYKDGTYIGKLILCV